VQLVDDSDAVFVGSVVEDSPHGGSPQGTAADGQLMPTIPFTDYTVSVTRSLKGALPLLHSNIVVTLDGAVIDGVNYVLDGGPRIDIGGTYLFFVKQGSDGRYRPLAGGSAVLPGDNTFLLSAEVTGGGATSLGLDDVLSPLDVSIRTLALYLDASQRVTRVHLDASYQLRAGQSFSCERPVEIAIDAPRVTFAVPPSAFRRNGSSCQYSSTSRQTRSDRVTVDLATRSIVADFTVVPARIPNPATLVLQLGLNQGSTTITFSQGKQVWSYQAST
jgi:hypothetical protein